MPHDPKKRVSTKAAAKPLKAKNQKPSENQPGDIEPQDAAISGESPAPGEATASFPIVGIGASAGGLAAFEAFFSAMPADTEPGMAFILVQHLAPDHKSILSELVKRYTRMQVFEVEDGMQVKPNCTYIIPPNRDMAFLNGTLQLLEPFVPRGQRLPIDFFFRSLAQDQRERAICIVLSGTGSDGTLGVRDIKGAGGMAMVQNPESTDYDAMPRNAIATGLVDFVLPPAEMPAQLIAYVAHAFGKIPRAVSPPAPKEDGALKKIFILLRNQTGHDFSQYKQKTIHRRIERRMAVHQIDDLGGYVRYLQNAPAEVEALFRDLLIGVTSFFRDTEAFKALTDKAIPQAFTSKRSGATVRVWVTGCSTGEEAYSIAILMQEHLDTLKQSIKIQVFATDIDNRAIETARAGAYPASIAGDVSSERLARFFDRAPDGGSYRISKSIRDVLIFSEQDVIKDPPFSKIDLISCRNLLIYMGGDLQKKLIPLFHYALNPGGFLFLGTSETVGDFAHLFAATDRKSKLYQRKEDMQRPAIGRFLPRMTQPAAEPKAAGKTSHENKVSLRELTERALLRQYAASGALVNHKGDILYLHGRTGRYLEPAPGEAGINILSMARQGLRRELTTALKKSTSHKELVRRQGLRVKTNGGFTTVHLTVLPMESEPGVEHQPELFFVIFEDAPEADQKQPETMDAADGVRYAEATPKASDARIAALQKDLRSNEEYLQTTIEQMDTSNEELKSTNEELQSVNEEMQSTNEELETSKEELQSVNEELATVNAELQQKVTDLSRANNDMNNLLAGTGIGTIFVDHRLCIQRFTPSVTDVINLILTDVGRPVGHIVSNLTGYDSLVEDIRAVLDSLIPKEIEVQARAGDWYQLRIRPYRTVDNIIEGAVITFVDITELKHAKQALLEGEAMHRLAAVVRDSNDAVTVQDLEGRILAWNPRAERMYGWSKAEALAMNIRDLIPGDLLTEALARIKQLCQSEVLEPYRTQRMARDGRIVDVWITATALVNETAQVYAIATTERECKPQKPGA